VAQVGNEYLWKWSAAHAVFQLMVGQGNATTCDTFSTGNGNVEMTNGGIHGFNIAFQAIGAQMTESFIHDVDLGGVNQVLVTDTASKVQNSEFVGGAWQTKAGAGLTSTTLKAIDLEGTCFSGGIGGLALTGGVWVAPAGLFAFNGSNTSEITLGGASKMSFGQIVQTTESNFADINNVNARVIFDGVTANALHGGSYYSGITITNASEVNIGNVSFNGVYYAVDTSSLSAGNVIIAGNLSKNTQATTTLNVPNYATVALGTNYFDKPGTSNAVSVLTGAQTNTSLPIPSGFTQVQVDGCGGGGAGGAGGVFATGSGGAGGGGADCHNSLYVLSDIGTGPLYVNGGGGGTGGSGDGAAGTEMTVSKNSSGCTAFSTFTGTSDTTHCIDTWGAGGGGKQGQSSAVSIGGGGGTRLASGASSSATATTGCVNSGGGNGGGASQGPACGAGGSGSTNTGGSVGGSSNSSGLGGPGGASGGGVNSGTGQDGAPGSKAQGCSVVAAKGTGGASPTDSTPGTATAFGYLPSCSGGGGGGANSGTAGNGSAGLTGAGGGGGGSANTGGAAGTGGNGGPGYFRATWIR